MASKLIAVLCLAYVAQGVPLDENTPTPMDPIPSDPIPMDPTTRNVHTMFNGSLDSQSHEEEDRITSYPITLHGGPVMATPVVYIIWYGAWTATQKTIIQNFVTGLGATPWWAINKAYGVNSLTFKKAIADNYSQGKNLTISTVWNSVWSGISSGQFPLDSNAIYLVLASSDVTATGFCSSNCGWHSYASSSTATYKFGFVALPPTTCGCYAQKPVSPNGDAAVDAAISVIAHELAEAATQPSGGGWCYSGSNTSCFSSGAVENADQCAWYFPNLASTNGYYYNLVMGTQKYLVQANWNLGTKTCTMA